MPATPRSHFFHAPRRARSVAAVAALVLIAMGSRLVHAESSSSPLNAAPAAAAIEHFHTVLIDVMKRGRSLGFEGRFRVFEPEISKTFDLAFMSRAALGSHWKGIAEADREQLVRAFTRMTVANYAAQFTSWGGERFEIGESVDGGQGTTVVRTRIVESDGHATALDYRLRPGGGGWRVVDVFLSGSVSQLALHRADYNSVFGRGGLPALLTSLDEKVKKLAAGTEKPKAR